MQPVAEDAFVYFPAAVFQQELLSGVYDVGHAVGTEFLFNEGIGLVYPVFAVASGVYLEDMEPGVGLTLTDEPGLLIITTE